jgi:hypothetical protein
MDEDLEDQFFQELGPPPEMWKDQRGCLGLVLMVLAGGAGGVAALIGITAGFA